MSDKVGNQNVGFSLCGLLLCLVLELLGQFPFTAFCIAFCSNEFVQITCLRSQRIGYLVNIKSHSSVLITSLMSAYDKEIHSALAYNM